MAELWHLLGRGAIARRPTSLAFNPPFVSGLLHVLGRCSVFLSPRFRAGETTMRSVLVLATTLGVAVAAAVARAGDTRATDDTVVDGPLGRRIDRAIQQSTGGGFW